jgi:membrane protease YdiL (CAAX protease family)
MNGAAPQVSARFIVVGALLQIGLAAALLAGGAVKLLPRSAFDGVGIAAGAALGWALYRVLAGGAPEAGRAAKLLTVARFGALLAGISVAEEVLWRGFAFHAIATTTSPVVALIATTIGFAAMHTFGQGWSGLRTHALTGLALGATVLVTGSLLSAVATHLSYNLMFLRTIRS